MPTIDIFILSPPLGFTRACSLLNEMSNAPKKYAKFVAGVALSVINGNTLPSSKNEHTNNCIYAIAYLCRACMQSSPLPHDEEIEAALNRTTSLNEAAIAGFLMGYNHSKNETSESTEPRSVNMGKLESSQWRLGVAMSSSCCDVIQTPYVSYTLCLSDTTNQVGNEANISHHTCELTYSEFQTLLNTVRDAVKVMDSL